MIGKTKYWNPVLEMLEVNISNLVDIEVET